MKASIDSIIIVGGGTSGWLAASHLARVLRKDVGSGLSITLIESPNIPTIGVGEGTVPAIRKTLREFGISEDRFIRDCEATFKQSVKFIDWKNNPEPDKPDYYHHVFDYPEFNGLDLTPYWTLGVLGPKSYAHSVSLQAHLCDAGIGPKRPDHNDYEGFASYAYHLDAAKFANLLAQNAKDNLGVKHILADVDSAHIDDNGHIKSVSLSGGRQLEADFFIDCTGFRSMLLGDALGTGFISKSDELLTDHAVAIQLPYEAENTPIHCNTIAAAQSAGWIWDIGLQSRRGLGYVYSSNHISHGRAEDELRTYVSTLPKHLMRDVQPRRIKMQIGYREQFWVGNCVGIGLSQGFVEPLEATGLLMYDAMSRFLADIFPSSREEIPSAQKQFNNIVRASWDRVIDFIKLHYVITQRDDTPFWRDNQNRDTVSDRLNDCLERWSYRPPSDYDFDSKFDVFNQYNYAYVLYGMGYETDLNKKATRFDHVRQAQKQSKDFAEAVQIAGGSLLKHRDLISKITARV